MLTSVVYIKNWCMDTWELYFRMLLLMV